jgi:hypothetical protein
MYDYMLGGTDNYQADREACRRLLELAPNTRQLSLVNRDFLIRAVEYLASEHGIERYLDHGSGLPTRNNVHQVAQRLRPEARVVYVDNDPIVLAHGRAMLEENDQTSVITADMLDTDDILNHDEVRRLIPLETGEPVVALFVSVLHCIKDEQDPWQLIRRLTDRLPSGSYLVLSHLASEDPQLRDDLTQLMHEQTGGGWGRVRSYAEVERFFEGLEVVDEIGEVSRWRPTATSARQDTNEWIELGGVARIP